MKNSEKEKQALLLEVAKGVESYLAITQISEEAGQYYLSSNPYVEDFVQLLKTTNLLETHTLWEVAEFFAEVLIGRSKLIKYDSLFDPKARDKVNSLLEKGNKFLEGTNYTLGIIDNYSYPPILIKGGVRIHEFTFFERFPADEVKLLVYDIDRDYRKQFSALEEIETNGKYTLYFNSFKEEYEIWDGLEKIMSRPQMPHEPELDLESAIEQLNDLI